MARMSDVRARRISTCMRLSLFSLGPYTRTACPPRLDRRPDLVTERIHARPRRQRVAEVHVQALDPVRHAAGGDVLDLLDVLHRLAAPQIVLVRLLVLFCERRGGSESLLHR